MSRQLFFAMSSTGKRQTDRDTPIPGAQIDERINITSRTFVGTEKTVEEIFDCIGEEVVDREVTRMLRRISIEAPYNPNVAARYIAYVKGVVASPSGTSTNKRVAITIAGATGGTYFLTLPAYDGLPDEPTAAIPYNVTASQLKYIIESLDNIGYGNTIVTDLGGGVMQVEFTGKRATAPVPTFTADATGLTPGGGAATVVVAQTQAGAQRTHAITENPDYQNYYTSFVVGFEDEPGSERELVGAQVESVRVNAPEGNAAMTMTIDIVARDLIPVPGYAVPACTTPRPMRLSDCALTHNAADLMPNLIDYSYEYRQNVVTGVPAYTGRGVKPSRLERGRRRTRTFTFRMLGGITQALRLEAETNPEAKIHRATVLRMGTPGENVTETIPNNLLTVDQAGGGVDFQAETDSSINRFVSAFDKIGGVAPSSSVAYIPQATALLQAPA
jgi:hypothetical protein